MTSTQFDGDLVMNRSLPSPPIHGPILVFFPSETLEIPLMATIFGQQGGTHKSLGKLI
jgi:hypothetical protein